MYHRYIGDRAFYRRVFGVAVPIIIQNGISNFVSLLDNIMVGQVGTVPMSGVSIVNGLLFVFNLCVFGASSGAGIFTAQFNGRIRAGQEPVQGEARRIDFLNEWNPAGFRNAESGRTGNRQNGWPPAQKIADPAQQQGGLRGNLCAMPVVIAVNDVVLTV